MEEIAVYHYPGGFRLFVWGDFERELEIITKEEADRRGLEPSGPPIGANEKCVDGVNGLGGGSVKIGDEYKIPGDAVALVAGFHHLGYVPGSGHGCSLPLQPYKEPVKKEEE